MSTLSELATKLYGLRERKTEANATLKEIQSDIDLTEQELLEEMMHQDLSRFDLQDTGSFHIANRRFFQIADREALIDFIHEQGDVDLLTVNHQTLNAYAKETYARKEADGDESFEMPGISYVTKTQIRVRKPRR